MSEAFAYAYGMLREAVRQFEFGYYSPAQLADVARRADEHIEAAKAAPEES